MAATSGNSWMPSAGPHPVGIGSSLSKALKARKGGVAPTKRSHLPDREFYSFRYKFKPESIDPTKPGSIEVRKGKETTSVTVERASIQPGEGQLFQGTEKTANEWECVLIYDEELGTFTLEKLESYVVLQYDRKTTMNSNRPSESPAQTPSSVSSPHKSAPAHDLDFEAQLEYDMLGMEDAEGESDEPLANKSTSIEALKQEMEEASDQEDEIPLAQVSSALARPSTSSSSSMINKFPAYANRVPHPPKPMSSTTAASLAHNKPISKGKGKGVKRERAAVEDSISEKPSKPAKVPRKSPPPVASSPSLSLPTSRPEARKTLALPLGGGTINQPLPHSHTSPPAPTLTQDLMVVNDSDDEWDEVVPKQVPPQTVTVTLASEEPVMPGSPEEDDEEEEIDMNAFQAEMNMHLGEDNYDDFLARAVSPEPEADIEPSVSGVPMSLNQYAGGDVIGDDNDFSSSSDESDD